MVENWIKELLDKPKVIGIAANPNEGKSNLINYLIDVLKGKAELKVFGLKNESAEVFSSVEELENFQNSVIFIDEFEQLLRIQDRHKSNMQAIERIFRTLTHPDSNNIIILSGLGTNYNNFVAQKLDSIIFKKISYDNIVKRTKVENCIKNFCDTGRIKQSSQLNLNKDEILIYNNNKYSIQKVPYMGATDIKKENKTIIKW